MEGPSHLLRRRYSLGAKIGEGGMGTVFAAEDLRLKRRVAVKVIASSQLTAESQERFRREAMASAQIAHPHIAAVQDYVPGEGGEPAMIVMELLDGENLHAALRREGALPVSRALDIAAQAASALGAAHAAGIVHRDIKPANLYLVRSSASGDFVKILDFGIAKMAGVRGITKTDEIVGTVEFMSPEQALGAAVLGPPSDVFSLGVVLYLMLTGRLPHAHGSVNEILLGLVEGTLVPIKSRAPDLAPEVIAVVDRALARDPAARFRDGAEMLAALDLVRGVSASRRTPMPDRAAASGVSQPSGIQQYAVLGRLATGGMAELFLARATSEGISRYVVLKQVLPGRDLEPRFQQMFLDEARIASQLRHHNIAQVHDVGRVGEALFLALEYVHGVDVRTLNRRHVAMQELLPLGSTFHIAAGTAAGLHHAHERRGPDNAPLGIIHRDVSPANIMVSFDGAVKVVDFGIAKAASRSVQTGEGTIRGKLAYMSPEQCRGATDLDRRSDIFSLGVVMFEMITGRRLFQRDTDHATRLAILGERAPAPSLIRGDVTPRLDAIVQKALEPDRERRYSTAAELLEDLEVAAVRDGIVTSSAATGRHLRQLFGDPPEPWHTLEASKPTGAMITLTSESTTSDIGPPTLPDQRAQGADNDLQQLIRRTVSLRAPGVPDGDAEELPEVPTLIMPGMETLPTLVAPLPPSLPTERGVVSEDAKRTIVHVRTTPVDPPVPVALSAPAIAPVEAPSRASHRGPLLILAGVAIAGAAAVVLALQPGRNAAPTSPPSPPRTVASVAPALVPADAAIQDAAEGATSVPSLVDASTASAVTDAALATAIDAAVPPPDAPSAAPVPRPRPGVDPVIAAAIRAAAAAEDYGTALARCKQLEAHSAETASTCTIAACGAQNVQAAKRYARSLSAARRTAIAQTCLSRGVEIN